jgi:hypothetical protein
MGRARRLSVSESGVALFKDDLRRWLFGFPVCSSFFAGAPGKAAWIASVAWLVP